MEPHRGTLILILGIVGWFIFPLAIAAWVMGFGDLKKMEAGTMDPAGVEITKVGKIIGMIVCIILSFGFVGGFLSGL